MQPTNQKRELIRHTEIALTNYILTPSTSATEIMRNIVSQWLDSVTLSGDPLVQNIFNAVREVQIDKQMTPEEMKLFLVGVLVAC